MRVKLTEASTCGFNTEFSVPPTLIGISSVPLCVGEWVVSWLFGRLALGLCLYEGLCMCAYTYVCVSVGGMTGHM